eukprot:g30734.t1
MKKEFQFLVEEKERLEEELKPKTTKPTKDLKRGKTEKQKEMEDEAQDAAKLVLEWSSSCPHLKFLIDADGQPLLSDEVPDPSEIKSVTQSKPYLTALTKACQMLETHRVALAKRCRLLGAGCPEEPDDGDTRRRHAFLKAETVAHLAWVDLLTWSRNLDAEVEAPLDETPTRSSPMPMTRSERLRRQDITPKAAARKRRIQIFGALSPMQADVTDEAKASVMGLLNMAKELEDLRIQTRHVEVRIHRAKAATDGKRSSLLPGGEDEDDGIPDANRELRREVQRKQKELNVLRKRWAEERGGREKAVQRQGALVGVAVRPEKRRRGGSGSSSEGEA